MVMDRYTAPDENSVLVVSAVSGPRRAQRACEPGPTRGSRAWGPRKRSGAQGAPRATEPGWRGRFARVRPRRVSETRELAPGRPASPAQTVGIGRKLRA